ncbi:helix-turn-helix domain-containing protein [Zobellella sp. DQSA1]|uniref:helix-turn-helix domain-containing protein n=1 Tax=Zobellella sp. DQSA1 TaxID=3342386 RepID=UPI0035C18DA4
MEDSLVAASRLSPRLQQVLHHIHQHLDHPLTLPSLASTVGCSRWQLQRDFQAATGLSLARYIRRLRLSRAAEWLLTGRLRQLDIALGCGFDSEVSFSRAFRQQFGCSPGDYRKTGRRRGLLTPLLSPDENTLLQIRIDNRPAEYLFGISGNCRGLFAESPDCLEQIPHIWQRFKTLSPAPLVQPAGAIGIDAGQPGQLRYWAGTLQQGFSVHGLERLEIPASEYLVIPHQGNPQKLARVLEWVILHWLPDSGYCYRGAFELETYCSLEADYRMEYWIPIAPAPKC